MIGAKLISRLFDPFIILMFLFGFTAYKDGLTGWDFLRTIAFLFATMILPPALLLLWAVLTKRVSNWDLSDRKQRVWALLVFVIFLLVDYVVMQAIGTPLMIQVFNFLCFTFAGFFAITLFFKISGHMSSVTEVILLFVYWYGWIMTPLLIILPFVGWSRIRLKRHTIPQVVGGFLYAIGIFFVAERLHLI